MRELTETEYEDLQIKVNETIIPWSSELRRHKLIEMETAAFYSCLKIMNKSGMALLLVSDNSQKKKSLVEKTIDDQNRYNYIRSNIIKKSIKLLI